MWGADQGWCFEACLKTAVIHTMYFTCSERSVPVVIILFDTLFSVKHIVYLDIQKGKRGSFFSPGREFSIQNWTLVETRHVLLQRSFGVKDGIFLSLI